MDFSVRVYGLLINERQEILISDEMLDGLVYTKFPGGGVEFGEGLLDALKREFIEECNTAVEVIRHFYTTEMFVKSSFDDKQIVSVYYLVRLLEELRCAIKTKPFDFDPSLDSQQSFRWETISALTLDDLAFPIDKHVLTLLKEQ
ncbi:NUDIX domain-containing protein [Spirosoma litoris]